MEIKTNKIFEICCFMMILIHLCSSLSCSNGATAQSTLVNYKTWDEIECSSSEEICFRLHSLLYVFGEYLLVNSTMGGCINSTLCYQDCETVLVRAFRKGQQMRIKIPFLSKMSPNPLTCSKICCNESLCNSEKIDSNLLRSELKTNDDVEKKNTITTNFSSFYTNSTQMPQQKTTLNKDQRVNTDEATTLDPTTNMNLTTMMNQSSNSKDFGKTEKPENDINQKRKGRTGNVKLTTAPGQGAVVNRVEASVIGIIVLVSIFIISF